MSMDIKEVAKKGGEATLAKYGPDHFRKLVQKRWAKVRETQKVK